MDYSLPGRGRRVHEYLPITLIATLGASLFMAIILHASAASGPGAKPER